MATVFDINKGINKPIVFKGFKAQYIIYIIVAMVLLLIVFAVLFLCGLNTYICLAVIVLPAIGATTFIQRMSNTYGEHGLLKLGARKKLPKYIRSTSATLFHSLQK